MDAVQPGCRRCTRLSANRDPIYVFNLILEEPPGSHVFRLFLNPDMQNCVRIFPDNFTHMLVWEWEHLLDSDQGDIPGFPFALGFYQVVINLTPAENDSFYFSRVCIGIV